VGARYEEHVFTVNLPCEGLEITFSMNHTVAGLEEAPAHPLCRPPISSRPSLGSRAPTS